MLRIYNSNTSLVMLTEPDACVKTNRLGNFSRECVPVYVSDKEVLMQRKNTHIFLNRFKWVST